MRPEPNAALAAILARDQEAGVDIFDDGRREPPAPGPPMVLPPLQRPVFPEPDWRAELAAAERRDAAPDGRREPDRPGPITPDDPKPPPPDRRYPRTTTTGRAWKDHR